MPGAIKKKLANKDQSCRKKQDKPFFTGQYDSKKILDIEKKRKKNEGDRMPTFLP